MYDQKKLIEIYAANYAAMSKFAIMIVKDKDAALDVLQNVALIIVKKGYSLAEVRYPKAFLITCIRRAALNYLRSESRACPIDPAVLEEMRGGDDSHAAINYLEWVMLLEKHLESYSSQLRSAFMKHYIDGYPLDTIAAELDMASNTLAQQFKRMRNKVANKSSEYKMLLMLLSYM